MGLLRSLRSWITRVTGSRGPSAVADPDSMVGQEFAVEKNEAEHLDSGDTSPRIKYTPGAITDQTAQRLARLLISEIKLYKKFELTESTHNVYDLLKEAIDNARNYYGQRLGKAVESMPDYFHAELVRLLCGGDASRLGPNYKI